jgi:hypothetical protein
MGIGVPQETDQEKQSNSRRRSSLGTKWLVGSGRAVYER